MAEDGMASKAGAVTHMTCWPLQGCGAAAQQLAATQNPSVLCLSSLSHDILARANRQSRSGLPADRPLMVYGRMYDRLGHPVGG
ncbi:hypothetical protein QJQ45_014814 [Haematococcus lacustris]|nr:hypothetical protein QJQ45_014814 [Haematococcus lacustris]